MKTKLFLLLVFVYVQIYAQITFQNHVISQNPSDGLLGATFSMTTDIDGDGDNDIIASAWDGKKTVWYENTDGQGTFGAQQIIAAGDYTAVLYPYDIDGDGDMDIVAGLSMLDEVVWYENTNGLGAFGPKQVIGTQVDYARSLYVTDIDSDGDGDLLVASISDDTISWFENTNGQGDFGPRNIIANDVDFAYDVYADDIDNDGDMDVLALSPTNNNNKIVWYENTDGQGTFGVEQIIVANPNGARNVRTGDMDNDGDADIIYMEFRGSRNIYWLENSNNGTSWTQHTISNGIGGFQLRVADVDADGDIDVIASHPTGVNYGIDWFENDGTGTNFSVHTVDLNAGFTWHMNVGDINNDNQPEIFATIFTQDVIKWYKNNSGTFSRQPDFTMPTYRAYVNKAADMDGDGDMDMVSFFDKKIVFYQNTDGQGTMNENVIVTSESIKTKLSGELADMDNDGDLDVVFPVEWDKTFIYQNDGLGNFTFLNSTTELYTAQIKVADFDNDGYQDIAEMGYYFTVVHFYDTNTGGYTPVFLNDINVYNYSQKINIATGDIDGDGLLDVITLRSYDNSIAWYRNTGNRTFGTRQIISSNADGAMSVSVADLDNDGDVDVISGSSNGNKLAWYENDGTGNFGVEQIITNNINFPNIIETGDIDNDGDIDIFSINGNEIVFLNNNGSGNFDAPLTIANNINGTNSIQIVDFNNDGKKDIITSSISDGEMLWMENTSNLAIQPNDMDIVNIYPNPTASILHVSNKVDVSSVEITDVTGKHLKTFTGHIINVDDLKQGVYLIVVKTKNNKKLVKKLIKK